MDLRKAIKLSIDHILEEGLTDTILQKPEELKDLIDPKTRVLIEDEVYTAINDARTCINKDDDIVPIDCFKKLNINRVFYSLIPKKIKFDYRRCAIIEPVDLIKFLAIVLMIAGEIEKARVPTKEDKVFSYRFKVSGSKIFASSYNYGSFRKKFKAKLLEPLNKVIVVCDISNFYDRLNLHKLESILLSLPTEKKLVKLINEILLSWAERNSYGLPVGNNASRILAEASLIEIDKYLISHDVDFIRFVDDYRIFAPDGKTAHYWLSLLVEKLANEGLMINQNKTDIKENFILLKDEELLNVTQEKKIEKILDDLDDIIETYEGGNEYQGEVPLKYLEIPEEQKDQIRKENEKQLLQKISKSVLINPDDFITLCKVIEVKKKFSLTKEIPQHLEKFPQFTPYAIDFLITIGDELTDDIRAHIKEDFVKNWMSVKDKLPEYILASLFKLFCSKHFLNKTILIKSFRTLPPKAGVYVRRVLLECLYNVIDRGEAKEIQEYYSKASNWEKREIILIARKHLQSGELTAFYKTIKADLNEPLIYAMVSKKS